MEELLYKELLSGGRMYDYQNSKKFSQYFSGIKDKDDNEQ
jgi:hypothetical protein